MSRRTWALAALFAAAAVIRLVAALEVNRTPLSRLDRWAQTDMHYFDGWARQIAAGDWTSAEVPMPMHRWHREIAGGYLGTHPEVQAALREAADAEATLWAHWMQAPRFYQDPLYPYGVAAVYAAAGRRPAVVIALQLAAGAGTVVLIALIASACFGEATGLCAGVLALLCSPLVFYEFLLLRDSLVAGTGLLLVWLGLRADTNGRPMDYFLFTAVAAAACLLKSTFLVFALAMIIILFVRRLQVRAPWRATAMATLGAAAIVLAPLAVRNLTVGAPVFSLAASGPMTFVSANEVRAMPDVGFGIDAPVLTSFLAKTDGGWVSAIRAAMSGQTIGSYAALLWRKWDRAWHWFEIPNNENFYYARTQVSLLEWLPVTFWMISPLALVGLVLGVRRLDRAWPLYTLVATTLIALVAFYVLGRFRVALLVAVIPFAALTIVEVARWVRAAFIGRTAAACAAVALVASWTGRPLAEDQVLIRTADWILPYSVVYQPLITEAVDRRDWNTAATRYLEFFSYEPAPAEILASDDATLAPELADMHEECARILRMAGRIVEADQQVQRAGQTLALRRLR
jgi:hypothetical protein